MFYRKNLPGWERAIRVIAGVVNNAVDFVFALSCNL